MNTPSGADAPLPADAPDGDVTYESDGGVAVITIRRPRKLNSITNEMASTLEGHWRRFDAGDDRVAILNGEGTRAFTAGVDLSSGFSAGYGFIPNVGVTVTKPIVCAVAGYCIGIGPVLVQQADLCVASDDAVFEYPEGRMGLGRGMLASLAGRIPHKIAAELLLVGERMSAETLHRHGLINRLVPGDQVLDEAKRMARAIAAQDGALSVFFKRNLDAVVARAPGEIAESIRWHGDQIAGNAALKAGAFEFGHGSR